MTVRFSVVSESSQRSTVPTFQVTFWKMFLCYNGAFLGITVLIADS